MLDAMFGGLVRVMRGELSVAMRDQGLMRGVGVVAFHVMLRRLALMARRAIMVLGRGDMMFFAREHCRHGILRCDWGEPARPPRRSEC